jgi:hypothetical protein
LGLQLLKVFGYTEGKRGRREWRGGFEIKTEFYTHSGCRKYTVQRLLKMKG